MFDLQQEKIRNLDRPKKAIQNYKSVDPVCAVQYIWLARSNKINKRQLILATMHIGAGKFQQSDEAAPLVLFRYGTH